MNDIEKLLAYANTQDWTISDGGKHLKCRSPEGAIVTVAKTSSDIRAIRNVVAEFRRHGLPVPRKAPKAKRDSAPTNAAVACINNDIDPFIKPFPHIEEIIGQWRSGMWFSPEGMPHDDDSFPGADDFNIACSIAAYYGLEWEVAGTPGNKVARQTGTVQSQPGHRKRRIAFCVTKYWKAGNPPISNICSCGYRVDDSNIEGLVQLAEHIVLKHESCEYEHQPQGELFPWADPTDLIKLIDDDPELVLVRENLSRVQTDLKKITSERDMLRGQMSRIKLIMTEF
jgi:hypothetical protein